MGLAKEDRLHLVLLQERPHGLVVVCAGVPRHHPQRPQRRSGEAQLCRDQRTGERTLGVPIETEGVVSEITQRGGRFFCEKN